MKITIITYNAPHLKTQQMIDHLVRNQNIELSILTIPFIQKPERQVVFKHRPSMTKGPTPHQLASSNNIPIQEIEGFGEKLNFNPDYMIIGGAGIIPGFFTKQYRIVNIHPGLIPAARGLDSFKWSILNNIPIGISIHIIDEGVDAGELIFQEETKIFKTDTIEKLAERHYNNEISLGSRFFDLFNVSNSINFKLPSNDPTKRMNQGQEIEMLNNFEHYKDLFGK
jgi:phosphoribosylglycinamide formyltransferase-1